METIRRIVYLLFRPSAEWDATATENTTVDALLRRYALALSLLAGATLLLPAMGIPMVLLALVSVVSGAIASGVGLI